MRLLLEHLWQSTVFAAVAWALTWMFRHRDAGTRYWIWCAASVKFLIPFAVLNAVGRQISVQTSQPMVGAVIGRIAEPLAAPTMISSFPSIPDAGAIALTCTWVLGAIAILVRWIVAWTRANQVARAAIPCDPGVGVPIRFSASMLEPGVIGLFRPVIVLPEGIAKRLSPAQLGAVIAHELCHVRRHDNLTASIHTLVQSMFWFNPLVWWIGRQLLKERERACDEAVLHSGAEPRTYAAGILEVCRFYLESHPPCIAGATGADLKQRIHIIMTRRVTPAASAAQKLALTVLGCMTIAVPVAAGVTITSVEAVQRLAAELSLHSAHIQVTPVGYAGDPSLHVAAGAVHMRNMSLRELISIVYDINRSQVFGGPDWLDSHYDIDARANLQTANDAATDPTLYRPMIEQLLARQFNLQLEVR